MPTEPAPVDPTVVARYRRDPDAPAPGVESDGDRFVRDACLTYSAHDGPERWARAAAALAADPHLTATHVHAAAAAADVHALGALLARDADAARRDGGPFRWSPLLSLTYSRVDAAGGVDAVLGAARLLLDHGADPDAGYLWHGLPTPFTALTGALGGGELGPERYPHHAHDLALAELLLERGADPNDGQGLYDRMFEPDDAHLELLLRHGLGAGDGGPWKARLGDALDDPATMLRGQLEWAVTHGFGGRVRLLAHHGVDVRSPLAGGRTPVALAAATGDAKMIDLLAALGAPVALDPVDAWTVAALTADEAALHGLEHADTWLPERARIERPALVLRAAVAGRIDAVRVLVGRGFDVDARGRADLPIEQPWETALHHAAGEGDVALTRELLSLGADPAGRDARFDATPLQWARHAGQLETADLLEPVSPA